MVKKGSSSQEVRPVTKLPSERLDVSRVTRPVGVTKREANRLPRCNVDGYLRSPETK